MLWVKNLNMDNYIKCYENAVTDEFCDLINYKV